MITIQNGTVVLKGTLISFGTGSSPSCRVCARFGIDRFMLKVKDSSQNHYFMCSDLGCQFAFPEQWTEEQGLVERLANQRARFIRRLKKSQAQVAAVQKPEVPEAVQMNTENGF